MRSKSRRGICWPNLVAKTAAVPSIARPSPESPTTFDRLGCDRHADLPAPMLYIPRHVANDLPAPSTLYPFFAKESRAEWFALGAILVCASLFSLVNLGNHYLWQDEAQTALISKTILTDGVPKGYDGKNHFSQEQGREYGWNYLYRWHTWFPLYLTAGSFALFGVGTFTARLPFALFGIATVALTYFFARRLWDSRRAAALAAFTLATCVPFFLLVRQCRYYSPSAFFALAAIYAYYEMGSGKRWTGVIFTAASVLLFQTYFPYWPTLLATVFVHAAIFRRGQLKQLAICSGVSLLLNLPWIIWFMLPPAVGYNPNANTSLRWYYIVSTMFLGKITDNVFPWIVWSLLTVVAGAAWFRRKKFFPPDRVLSSKIVLLVAFVFLNLAALTLTSPDCFFRYLAPLIPFLCVGIGLILAEGFRLHPALGIGVMAFMLAMSPIRNFGYELTHDYDSPMEGVSKYLNEHAKPDDVVVVTYGDMTVKFYTNFRVIGGLTGEDFEATRYADWIVIRRTSACLKDFAMSKFISENIPPDYYSPIQIDYPDIPFDNREEPAEHLYRTQVGAPTITVYQRRSLRD